MSFTDHPYDGFFSSGKPSVYLGFRRVVCRTGVVRSMGSTMEEKKGTLGADQRCPPFMSPMFWGR